jgi:hypothetical protein
MTQKHATLPQPPPAEAGDNLHVLQEQLHQQLRQQHQQFSETLQLMGRVWGVQVLELHVAQARRQLPNLIRDVARRDQVVVIRNAKHPDEPGVVVMSESRAVGSSPRGGMNLAQLVQSFQRSPVKLRRLAIEEQPTQAEEELMLGHVRQRNESAA